MVKKLKDIKKSNKNEEEYYEPEEEEDYEYDPADFETGQYLEEDEYNVEEIVDMKIEKGKKLYFIKWDGYPHSQNTWEPADHLTKVLYMVEQFEEEYAKRKSLTNMPKENPKYFGGDEKLVKAFNDIKKKKGRDLNEEKEIILKKRKMDTQDDFDLKEDERKSSIKEPVREKKSVSKDNKTSVKEKVAPPPEEDLIQEITMYKEDLEPKKKKDTKSKTPIKGILDLEDFPTHPEPVVSMQVEKPAKEVKQSVPEIKPTISDPKPKENIQQAPNKEVPKEKPKEIPKELPKDTTKEVPTKDIPKEALKEISKEKLKEIPKEVPKDIPKEIPKEAPKEVPKDTTKEVPTKDIPKEALKEISKEKPKEIPKEASKEVPKQVMKMQEEVKEPLEIVFTKAKDLDQILENKESKEMKIAPFNVNKDVGRAPKSAVPISALKKAREKNVKAAPRKKDKTGAFRNKDRPKAILSIKPGKDGGLVFLVEWHNRSDGFQPENSLVTNEDMKLNDPYFLIDFYEDKLVKINKKEKKRRQKEKAAQLNGVPEHEPMHTEEEPAVINNIVEAEVQQPEKPSENVIVNTNKLSEPKSIKSPASIKDFIEELKRNKDSVKSKDANDTLEPMDEVENKRILEESNTSTQNRMEVESSFKTPVFKGGESETNKKNSGSKDLFMRPKEVKSASKENPFEDIEKMLVEEPSQQQDKESRKSLNKDRKENEAEKEGSNSNEEQGNLVSVGS